jgi:hypothetical protein
VIGWLLFNAKMSNFSASLLTETVRGETCRSHSYTLLKKRSALSLYCCMLNTEAANTNFIVFCLNFGWTMTSKFGFWPHFGIKQQSPNHLFSLALTYLSFPRDNTLKCRLSANTHYIDITHITRGPTDRTDSTNPARAPYCSSGSRNVHLVYYFHWHMEDLGSKYLELSNTISFVFLFCFVSVFCTLCCQFLWIGCSFGFL